MTNILVTGGAGFLGSNLVRSLVEKGKRVRVLDNGFRGSCENLTGVRDKIEFIEGDIREKADVRSATRGMDTVFHLAYINGTEYFYSKPQLVLGVGIKGTLNAIESAMEEGVGNFIFASSSEVYQTPEVIPTPESVAAVVPDVKNPRASYGGGKITGELLTWHYREIGDKMRRIVFRPHNIYGPNMGWEHVIPQLVKKIYEASSGFKRDNATIKIQGTGKETRSFCYIDDAVDGMLVCSQKGTNGEIYNVGKEEEISIVTLVNKIGDILKIKITIEKNALAGGSPKRRCPDIRKLKALGYFPRVSLDDGLKNTVNWYKEKLENENKIS